LIYWCSQRSIPTRICWI